MTVVVVVKRRPGGRVDGVKWSLRVVSYTQSRKGKPAVKVGMCKVRFRQTEKKMGGYNAPLLTHHRLIKGRKEGVHAVRL